MKFKNLIFGMCLLTTLNCVADNDDIDPRDPEFGTTQVDGKADNLSFTDNEITAILGLVNQPLNDDPKGEDFFELLDSKLHKRAAQNIANYRSGNDGAFGNTDDQIFPDFKTLDGISYVGPVALHSLLDLAKEEGFYSQTNNRDAKILEFVNQALVNDNEGLAFFELIDSVAHKTASHNIAEYRSGEDGRFGTNDDQRFATIQELDDIKYVGRAVMKALFNLAISGQVIDPDPTTIPVSCGVSLNPINGRYSLRSVADLKAVKNSGCTFFDKGVYLFLPANSFPRIDYLANIETIKGDLEIVDASKVALSNLKEIHGKLTIFGGHRVEGFNNLVAVSSIKISGVGEVTGFNALQQTETIDIEVRSTSQVSLPSVDGFSKLENANRLEINGQKVAGFQKLNTLGSLELAKQYGIVDYKFPALKEVGELKLDLYKVYSGAIVFPVLTKTSYFFVINVRVNTFSFPKLKESTSIDVRGSKSINFPSLETINGTFNLHDVDGDFTNYPKLKTIAGGFSVRNLVGDLDDFDALLSVGTLRLKTGCNGTGQFSGFENLINLSVLDITFTEDCTMRAFNEIRHISGSVTIQSKSRSMQTTINGFDNLLSAGRMRINGGRFPKLKTVIGSLELNTFQQTWSGLSALESINGDLKIGGKDLETISSFEKLRTVNGDIFLQAQIWGLYHDSIVDNLSGFTGEVLSFN